MGPKKKKGRSPGDATKNNAGTNRGPKGVPQVQISAENERRLRRLLQNAGSSSVAPTSSAKEALSDLGKKQAAKRLRNIYEKLASEGFSNSQIELGLAALPSGEATLEAVLDWLCLNLPGHELPIKFSSGAAEQEMEGGSVQLISVARADWVPSSNLYSTSERDPGDNIAVRICEGRRKDLENEDKAQQADWIRQYVAQQEEEQDVSGSSSSNGDKDSDWELWLESKEQRQSKQTRSVVDPATRGSSLAAEFQAAKEAAVAAKRKGDKQKQAMAGHLILELKRELTSLGLSEDILNVQSGPLDAMGSGSVKADSHSMVKLISCEGAMSGNLSLPEHGDNYLSCTKEGMHAQEMPAKESQSESEGDILNMFDEDSAKFNDLPDSVVELKKKQEALAWAMKGEIVDKKKTAQKKQASKALTQEDIQKQPKAVLQQQCQKNGWEVPKYEKLCGGDNSCSYKVSIVQPSSGHGRNKKAGGLTIYNFPEVTSGFKSTKEAQNAVATWALFSLFPDIPLYRILPEPYRAMMLQWHMKGSKAEMDKDLESNRRTSFVDALINTLVQHDKNPVMSDTMVLSNSFGSTDDPKQAVATSAGVEEEKNDKSSYLLHKFQEKTERTDYKVMLESRSRLPVSAVKNQLLEQIHGHEVVVVSGETGSGKTTQVPQYILEDMINRNCGASCNIICTQPRRLAAISVAHRVAAEQGEEAPGSKKSLVGYQVRLDNAWNSGTKLLFCTTGILLRRLAGDRGLSGVSHVIVDEVHERSVLGDFALIILKDLVEKRRNSGQYPLKIVLMSATVDASMFSQYFGNCPILTVKGRTFPVNTVYLEDVYEMLDYKLTSDSPAAVTSNSIHPKKNKIAKNLVNSNRGRQSLVESGWGDEIMLEDEPHNPLFDEQLYHGYSKRTKENLFRLNEDVIDFDLLEDLIVHIDQTGENGAILVFLPGMADIDSLMDRLAASKHFRDAAADWLIPLHSSVSVTEQQKAFQRPPSGVRKVVAATNIAETSITIEDVVHVIDCGKHKEIQYDPHRGMSRMVETWISQANAKQRWGRAGRVKSGYCFCLYTKHRSEKLMRQFQVPEMLRVPLVELCLQIKFLSLGGIESFLEKAMEPPKAEAINDAISTLYEVRALDEHGELTALGFHLARLPVDVRIGKMMLYGAILGCLSPVLTIAACLSHKPPFFTPREQLDAAERAKRAFATLKDFGVESPIATTKGAKHPIASHGQQSDHLAMVAAYNSWIMVLKQRGTKAAYEHCKSNFLSASTLNMLRDMRSQFAILLADIGFIHISEGGNTKMSEVDKWVDDPKMPFNCNAYLAPIVKATLCAGLYPNVAKMDEESVRAGHANALGRRAGLASSKKVCWFDGRQEVFIHPSSVNHTISEFNHPFLIFHEKVKTSKIYIRDTSVISPYTLLLFGGTITVQHQTGQVSIDGWLKMDAPAQIAVLFKEIRMALDSALRESIKNPQGSVNGPSKEVVQSIVKLLMDEVKSHD